MPTTVQLREQRANVWSQMTGVMDTAEREGRDLTVEERTAYDAAEADLDRIGNDVARQERHEQHERDLSVVDRSSLTPPPAGGDTGGEQRDGGAAYAAAFNSWLRRGAVDLNAEERQALAGGYVDGSELRAAGVLTGGAGGYTVPPLFRDVIIETMKAVGSVRAVADHIDTTSGANIPWPTVDDTNNVGAILAENTQVTEQDVVFGTASLDAYMYTSKLVRVSLQLLQDSGVNIEDRLGKILGRRIGRIQNQHYTTGTGVSQPDGIATSAVVGKQGVVGQTTTVTYDDLVDVMDSIDPAYLGGAADVGDSTGAIQWMFSQTFRKGVRKIKDAQGRPLWEPSLQVGTPDSLLGYGIVLNNDMPAPAPNAKSALFGDFKEGYIVRDVSGIQVLRLAERYADYLQVGFLAFARSDGTQQNASAYKAYQHSAT